MKLLTRLSDGRVLARLGDADAIEYTSYGVLIPGRVLAGLDQSSVGVYLGTDTPTADDGRWAYDGADFTDLWPYARLTPLAFWRYVTTLAGLDAAARKAARDDPYIEELWWEFSIATEILRDSSDTVAALDALIALGHLAAQDKADVLANWPRAAA